MDKINKPSIVMLGATGAVGGHVVKTLLAQDSLSKLNLLGRRPVPDLSDARIAQHKIAIFDPQTYEGKLEGHDVAICTLGVGEPSKMKKEDFVKIDKDAVLAFAKACKQAGVKHFELLGSVGASAKSSVFYLRVKGELVEELKTLSFERLSIFQPSMILTPTNRYGFSQALTLAIWPSLKPLLLGGWRKYRGIPVEQLGEAIAMNVFRDKAGFEVLHWNEFQGLIRNS